MKTISTFVLAAATGAQALSQGHTKECVAIPSADAVFEWDILPSAFDAQDHDEIDKIDDNEECPNLTSRQVLSKVEEALNRQVNMLMPHRSQIIEWVEQAHKQSRLDVRDQICALIRKPIIEYHNKIKDQNSDAIAAIDTRAVYNALAILSQSLSRKAILPDVFALACTRTNLEALEALDSLASLSDENLIQHLAEEVHEDVMQRKILFEQRNQVLREHVPKTKQLKDIPKTYRHPKYSVNVEESQEQGFVGYQVTIDGTKLVESLERQDQNVSVSEWMEKYGAESVSVDGKTMVTVRTRYSKINDWIKHKDLKTEKGYWMNFAKDQAATDRRPFVPFPSKSLFRKFLGLICKGPAYQKCLENRRLRLEMVLENLLQDPETLKSFITYEFEQCQKMAKRLEAFGMMTVSAVK